MIKNKDINLTHAEESQANLESDLTDINVGNRKSSPQKKVIKNAKTFFYSRQAVINFYKDYSSMAINTGSRKILKNI